MNAQKGCGYVHVTYFCIRNFGLRKISPRAPLTKGNDLVDGGPMFYAPWMVSAIHLRL